MQGNNNLTTLKLVHNIGLDAKFLSNKTLH